jgi:hypothetical protein
LNLCLPRRSLLPLQAAGEESSTHRAAAIRHPRHARAADQNLGAGPTWADPGSPPVASCVGVGSDTNGAARFDRRVDPHAIHARLEAVGCGTARPIARHARSARPTNARLAWLEIVSVQSDMESSRCEGDAKRKAR